MMKPMILIVFLMASVQALAPSAFAPPQRQSSSTVAFLHRNRQQESSAFFSSVRYSNPSNSDGDPPATEGRERNNFEDPKNEKQEVKRGYQRAEEWDEDQKSQNQMDQRIQFEGMRGGNRFRQNEILRHHLGGF